MNIIKKNKQAFTIIELIVVIAIIGILVLFGLPKLLGYVEKAHLTRIMHDVKVMETMMEDELATNVNKNFDKFVDNGKDLGLLIEANRLFEKEGYADNIQYVPMKGEIDGLNDYKYAKQTKSDDELLANHANINDDYIENNLLGMGGPEVQTENEFKEMYERYKIIPEEYKTKAGSKLKGTFYTSPNAKVYYEPDKPIGLKGEKKPLACSAIPEPDYTFEHEIGKIVKYHGNAEHLIIPDYFLVNGKCWPVRIIGEAAFMQGNFKSILVPGTVVTIEGNAFKDLELPNIYIPGSVTTIYPGAFDGNYEVVYGGSSSHLNGGSGGSGGSYTYPGGGSSSYVYRYPNSGQAGVVFNPGTGTIVKGGGSGGSSGYIPPYINVNGKDVPVKKIAKGGLSRIRIN